MRSMHGEPLAVQPESVNPLSPGMHGTILKAPG